MSIPRVSQLAEISVIGGTTNPRISQLAKITVTGPPSTPPRLSQLAVVSVIMNNENLVSLDNVIGLDCWTPCTSYGTNALIVYL